MSSCKRGHGAASDYDECKCGVSRTLVWFPRKQISDNTGKCQVSPSSVADVVMKWQCNKAELQKWPYYDDRADDVCGGRLVRGTCVRVSRRCGGHDPGYGCHGMPGVCSATCSRQPRRSRPCECCARVPHHLQRASQRMRQRTRQCCCWHAGARPLRDRHVMCAHTCLMCIPCVQRLHAVMMTVGE